MASASGSVSGSGPESSESSRSEVVVGPDPDEGPEVVVGPDPDEGPPGPGSGHRPHTCYILTNREGTRTYVGYTNNPGRRLRQHNGEIKGGARATRGHRGAWAFLALLSSPQLTHHTALSLEWHIKHPLPGSGGRGRSRGRERGGRGRMRGAAGRIATLPLVLRHPKFAHMRFAVRFHPAYAAEGRAALVGAENVDVLVDVEAACS